MSDSARLAISSGEGVSYSTEVELAAEARRYELPLTLDKLELVLRDHLGDHRMRGTHAGVEQFHR